MRLLLLINVSLLLAWQAASAQSADDFFNSGAHSYISNNVPQALVAVEKGLKQYPDNVKLKKLYELLKQHSRQQSQKKQSQQNQQKKERQKSQKNQKNQHKNQQSQNQSEKQKEQRQKQQAQSSPKEKQHEQKEQRQQAGARQMSPQEARRLLDAQKGDEQFLQLQPKGKPQNRPAEDW